MEKQFRAILLDESADWNADFVNGSVYGVYAYDPNQMTHCCELTPSYNMECVGNVGERDPDWDFQEMSEDCYMHCRLVDSFPHVKSGGGYESLEDWIEYLRCNGGEYQIFHELHNKA